MKLFSTLFQRIATIVVVLIMAFNVNAERTFATLAEMHADTTLKDGDQVKITGDVVFEYCYMYYFVVSDKEGTATCMNNYCYYIRNIIEDQSIKAGDVFKNYSGTISISPSGVYRLEPYVENKKFVNGITIEHISATYDVKTTKVTVKDLLDNPNMYDGKVVSLDKAITKNVGHTSYLIQGEDTLKSFTISGLNNDQYPTEIVIDRALFKVESAGHASLCMSQNDFGGAYKTVKSLKATGLTENIKIELNVQVIRKEVYEGKTYVVVYEGEGKNLINYAGLRILLNTETAEDKNIKTGDIISIKSNTAQYTKFSQTSIYSKHSLLTLNDHETKILSNEPIKYNVIYPDNIGMLETFEFLPVSIYGVVSLTGKENATHKEHNFAEAIIGEDTKIYVDIANKPSTIGNSFILNGCIEIPLWQEKSARTYIVPLSEKDFTSDLLQFDNIMSVISYGAHANSAIKYQINSDMTVTNATTIAAVGEEDNDQDVIFVSDGTASLMLIGWTPTKYALGDIITNVVGTYSDFRNTQVTTAGELDFGVGRRLYLDSAMTYEIKKGERVAPIYTRETTIAELLENEEWASSIVRISDFTFDTIVEVVQDVTVENYYIYQGSDSIAVDSSFAAVKDNPYVDLIYYLNGFYTRLMPYAGVINGVPVDNVFVDDELFVADGIVYAQGAEIEVYDVMGRLVACGMDKVNVGADNRTIFVIRTKYSDGQMFVTKVVNR
jgi:hypothetical protein